MPKVTIIISLSAGGLLFLKFYLKKPDHKISLFGAEHNLRYSFAGFHISLMAQTTSCLWRGQSES